MAKVRLTKSELKTQRDALKRFERYLPTLQLKKQQLQLETRRVREELARVSSDERDARSGLQSWVDLFASSDAGDLDALVVVAAFAVHTRNIAGLDTPVFGSVTFRPVPYDPFTTPLWFDDAVDALRGLVELGLRRSVLGEQLELLERELRIVTQRVNLFEKVKIPEARETIRRIQIYLGDQQTNAVGRAKIAKEKFRAREAAVLAAS